MVLVVLGQDLYCLPIQSHGLGFRVQQHKRNPPKRGRDFMDGLTIYNSWNQ